LDERHLVDHHKWHFHLPSGVDGEQYLYGEDNELQRLCGNVGRNGDYGEPVAHDDLTHARQDHDMLRGEHDLESDSRHNLRQYKGVQL
jgi:hypothetical protein